MLIVSLIIPSAVAEVRGEPIAVCSTGTEQIPMSMTSKVTVECGTTEELMTAVYAHCDYRLSLSNAVYAESGADDGIMLTDLVYTPAKTLDGKEKGEGWVRLKSENGNNYSATVTLDIGFLAQDVFRFYLRAFRGNESNAEMPSEIHFYASADGNSFEYVGRGTTMTDINADNTSAVFGVTLENGISARYIRATMTCVGGKEAWINEVGAAAMGNTFRANDDESGLIRDSQGLVYRIIDGVAEVYGMETENIGQNAYLVPSENSFDLNGTYYLGVGSDNEVKVVSDLIGEGRTNYSGVPNNIQYIVIHNTATVEEDTDAERYNYRMHNMEGESGWHYTVDENVIYHSLADSVVGFHSGASYNYRSIGIEICVNGAPSKSANSFYFSGSAYDEWVEGRFRKSLKNAAMLTAELLTRYGLSTDAVIQHYDVTKKDCPLWMRANDGALWKEFLGYVEDYYYLFNGDSPAPIVRPKSDIVIPDYIKLYNGDVYPVSVIAPDAFAYKSELLRSVFIGKSVNTISVGCFDGSTSLESITVSDKSIYFTASGGEVRDSKGETVLDVADITGSAEPSPKEDCTLDIRTIDGINYIFDVTLSRTVADYASSYGADVYSAVALDGTRLADSDIPGTATLLEFEGVRLYLILRGDGDGNGSIDEIDYILLKRTCMSTYYPIKRQRLAMDVNSDEALNSLDYILIKRHVFGTFDLTN